MIGKGFVSKPVELACPRVLVDVSVPLICQIALKPVSKRSKLRAVQRPDIVLKPFYVGHGRFP